MKIFVLGPQGTFCDEAANIYTEKRNIMSEKIFCEDIDCIFENIKNSETYGIVPIENTLAGHVHKTLDNLMTRNVTVIDEIYVPVKFSLLSNVKNKEDIKSIFVQFKTKEECTSAIKQFRNARIIMTESNMQSFHYLYDSEKGCAAIVPQRLYDENNENFKIKDVTDSDNNTTRFFVTAPKFEIQISNTLKRSFKASLYVLDADNKPGMLFGILKEFSEKQINLISIMSKPTKKDVYKRQQYNSLARYKLRKRKNAAFFNFRHSAGIRR